MGVVKNTPQFECTQEKNLSMVSMQLLVQCQSWCLQVLDLTAKKCHIFTLATAYIPTPVNNQSIRTIFVTVIQYCINTCWCWSIHLTYSNLDTLNLTPGYSYFNHAIGIFLTTSTVWWLLSIVTKAHSLRVRGHSWRSCLARHIKNWKYTAIPWFGVIIGNRETIVKGPTINCISSNTSQVVCKL